MKIWINDTENNIRILSETRGEISRTTLLSTRGAMVLPSLTSNTKGSSWYVAYGLSIAGREPHENALPFRQELDSLHLLILKTKSFLFHPGKSVS